MPHTFPLSLLCFTIEEVYFYTVYFSKLKYRVLKSVFGLTMWLQKTLEGLIVCFFELGLTTFHKLSPRTHHNIFVTKSLIIYESMRYLT